MDNVSKSKIIVVFTDIRGSSRWTRQIGNEEQARINFMMAHEREALFFRQRTNAEFYKRLGDGRMLVYELTPPKQSVTAANVLTECLGLIQRVERLISKMPTPRPAGFRVRIMSGDGVKEFYDGGESDWGGDLLNSCHEFLSHAPEIPLIIDDTTKKLIDPLDVKIWGLTFEQLKGGAAFWTVNRQSR